jgi:hypothetical protein
MKDTDHEPDERAAVEQRASAWIAALRESESMPRDTERALWRRLEHELELELHDTPRARIGERAPEKKIHRRVRLGVFAFTLAAAAALALALFTDGERRELLTPGSSSHSMEAPYRQGASTDAWELVTKTPRGVPDATPPDAHEHTDTRASTQEAASADEASNNSAPTPSDTDAHATRRVKGSPQPARSQGAARPALPDEIHARDGATHKISQSTRDDSLAAEISALHAARAALTAEDPARALELLAACARRFPAGRLGEERSALRIIALCALGKHPQGRAEASSFLDRYPNSALESRVHAACERPAP